MNILKYFREIAGDGLAGSNVRPINVQRSTHLHLFQRPSQISVLERGARLNVIGKSDTSPEDSVQILVRRRE